MKNIKQYKKEKIKPIKKRVAIIMLAAALSLSTAAIFDTPVLAVAPTHSAQVLEAGIDRRPAGRGHRRSTPRTLQISGYTPLARTADARLNAELNYIFTNQQNAFIQSHLTSARSIHFSSYVYTSGEFVSIAFVKTAISISTTSGISTVVINADTGQIIDLPDYNINIVQLINNQIESLISQNPRAFASSFSGIQANHPFYMDGDDLNIPFATATLFANTRDIERLTFSISKIQDLTLDESHFKTLTPTQYNTMMLQLEEVISRFGYAIAWDSYSESATIYLNGIQTSVITIGKNSYSYRGGHPQELEMPPMLHNGNIYVPVSFFSTIMGIPTTIGQNGQIYMTRYNGAIGMTSGIPAIDRFLPE